MATRRTTCTHWALPNPVRRSLLFLKSVFMVIRRYARRPLFAMTVLLLLLLTIMVKQHLSQLPTAVDAVHKVSVQLVSAQDCPSKSKNRLADTRGIRQFSQIGVNLKQISGNNPNDKFVIKSSAPSPRNEPLLRPSTTTVSLKDSISSSKDPLATGKDPLSTRRDLHDKQSDISKIDNFTSTPSYKQRMLSPLGQEAAVKSTLGTADLLLSVLVVSRPNNVLLRQAARQTWGQASREMGVSIRFVVGRMENWDQIVDREHFIHKDVIILNEEDTYENLPVKVMSGYSWLLAQPVTPMYVMKVDDDTIVNLPYLLQELQSGVINSTQILGAICINSTVIRDPRDKWAVSFLDYPFPSYPRYAFGGGYVMSASAAATLMSARSSSNDRIHLEDVYITGMLASKSHITHVTHQAFSLLDDPQSQPMRFHAGQAYYKRESHSQGMLPVLRRYSGFAPV